MENINNNKSTLRLAYGEDEFGVHGETFHCMFSHVYFGMTSLVMNGKEWLYKEPRPTFWRALTDNDRGNGLHYRSGMWFSADMFPRCVGFELFIDGQKNEDYLPPKNNQYTAEEKASQVEMIYTYETMTHPQTKVTVHYTVVPTGEITVNVHYFGKENLPTLPVFGLRFILPTKAVSYTYEGLSGETYPDRMAGGVEGVCTIDGLPVTPYLVPQDSNMHMQTKWLEVIRDKTLSNVKKEEKPFSLKFSHIDQPFAFTCIPYTAQELESAEHQEELPAPRRTVVCILGAVRGVGGFDSWQADVEEAYHIDATEDISYSFKIEAGK